MIMTRSRFCRHWTKLTVVNLILMKMTFLQIFICWRGADNKFTPCVMCHGQLCTWTMTKQTNLDSSSFSFGRPTSPLIKLPAMRNKQASAILSLVTNVLKVNCKKNYQWVDGPLHRPSGKRIHKVQVDLWQKGRDQTGVWLENKYTNV